jgi:hypothetical protein
MFQATVFDTTSSGTMTVDSPGWSPVNVSLTSNSNGDYGVT